MLSHPLAKYNKTIVGTVGVVVSILSVIYVNATWLPPLVALLTSLGIYGTPNAE